ncbi:MAG: DUF2206 domain-containing protein [Patescibacteria group bacterium]|jgi:uncharacterized membrane protein
MSKQKLLAILVVALSYNVTTLLFPSFIGVMLPISLCTIAFFPGYLLLLLTNGKQVSKLKIILSSIGLSLSLLLIGGLCLNTLYKILGVQAPLARIPMVISLDILYVVVIATHYLKKQTLNKQEPGIRPNFINILLSVFPIIFPLFSILGALFLNSGVQSYYTYAFIFLILIYIFFLLLFEKKIKSYVYPIAIFCIGISLIYSYSLRSNYLVGWDIQTEYRVLQITREKLFWSMNNINNAYNATLSTSLLPTIIGELTGLSNLWIFKALYPFLFAFTPVAVFALLSEHTKKSYAFLATFFFMSQYQFMQQMPALARQEIAMLFFTLTLYTWLGQGFSGPTRKFLFILFGIATIFSHYSTAYIMLIVMVCVYAFGIAVKILKKLPFMHHLRTDTFLGLRMIMIFAGVTVIWYGLVTNTAFYLSDVVRSIVTNFSKFNHAEVKSEQARISIIGVARPINNNDVQNYIHETTLKYKKIKWLTPLPATSRDQQAIKLASAQFIPPINRQVSNLAFWVTQIDQKVIKALISLGVLFIVLGYMLNKFNIQPDFVGLFPTLLVLIVAMTVLPSISISYNIERLYQQSLVVLSLGLIAGTHAVLFFLHDLLKKMVLFVLVSVYFLFSINITSQFLGGSASLNFNNFGEDYERFYIKPEEVAAAKWLETGYSKNSVVFTDQYGQLRLQSHTRITNGIMNDVIPGTIDKYSYVYSTYTNTIKGISKSYYLGTTFAINYPFQFISLNKNLIYTNKSSKIFK